MTELCIMFDWTCQVLGEVQRFGVERYEIEIEIEIGSEVRAEKVMLTCLEAIKSHIPLQ